ncbi:MAG TPA: phosphatase PAP2 family protein [Allosphingosinicella sp.]|jgi:membrane-associated phospholipid phosphatase
MQRVGFAGHWPLPFRTPTPVGAAAGEARPAERVWPAWSLVLLGLVAAVDALWLVATRVSLSMPGLVLPWSMAALIAVLLRRSSLRPRVRTLLSGLAFMLAAWPALRVYNHLVMTTGMPLADARLSAWDSALGFDWLGYLLWLDRHPLLLYWMDWAYGGLTAYSAAAFVLVLLLIGAGRAREFLLLFLITAVAASTIGLFFPALAAMTYYAPDPELFRTVPANLGAYHVDILDRLRTAAAPVLDLRHLPGLTTFPSFHTAMGVVVVWCSRGSRILFAPMLALNALMIASTPAFGSHYFVDILAGAALAAAAVLLLGRIERGRVSEG